MRKWPSYPSGKASFRILFVFARAAVFYDFVNQAKVLGLFGRHKVVALKGGFDGRQVFAGVFDVDLVQASLELLGFPARGS